MFGEPTSGFVRIELPGFAGLASFYTNDVVAYTLLTLRVALTNDLPICLSFDAEGEEHTVVATYQSCFATTEYFDDSPAEVVIVPRCRATLTNEVLDAFDSRFNDWSQRLPPGWTPQRFRSEIDVIRALLTQHRQ